MDDRRLSAASCPTRTLAPGASTTCTATATLTQADVDAGSLDNTATAQGTTPGDVAVRSAPDSTSTPTSTTATLTLVKSASTPVDTNGNGRTDAGDTLAFGLRVTNTGAVTLTGVRVDDPLVGQTACPTTTLAPGASTTCTATYAITQADVDAGVVVNSATAAASDPTGASVVSPASRTSTATSTVASLSLTKTADAPVDADGSGRIGAGDTIAFTLVVTNTGDQTVTDVRFADPVLPACAPAGALAPRASATCRATYRITQADVDAGTVTNRATATGRTPAGVALTAPPATTTTTLPPTDGLVLTKQASTPTDANANGRVDAGDTVAFTLTATNTGTRTLFDLRVLDPRVTQVVCPVATLQPGQRTVCTATATITQADVDAGSVDNTARAVAANPVNNPVRSETASTSTPTSRASGLTLVKTALEPTDVDGNGRIDAGDTIDYSFDLTNTGAVTLTDVRVDDPPVPRHQLPDEHARPGRQHHLHRPLHHRAGRRGRRRGGQPGDSRGPSTRPAPPSPRRSRA